MYLIDLFHFWHYDEAIPPLPPKSWGMNIGVPAFSFFIILRHISETEVPGADWRLRRYRDQPLNLWVSSLVSFPVWFTQQAHKLGEVLQLVRSSRFIINLLVPFLQVRSLWKQNRGRNPVTWFQFSAFAVVLQGIRWREDIFPKLVSSVQKRELFPFIINMHILINFKSQFPFKSWALVTRMEELRTKIFFLFFLSWFYWWWTMNGKIL